MKRWIALGVLASALVAASPARASFHLWDVSEVFTNADGSIQFIELVAPAPPLGNGQHLLTGHTIATETLLGGVLQTFTFPSNLPSNLTGSKHFLIATPNFLADAGIAPDYEIPAGFIEVGVAEQLNFADFDFFVLAGLPTDGVNALYDGGGTDVATPTNFAGETGTIVPEPGASALAIAVLAALHGLTSFRRAGAWRSR